MFSVTTRNYGSFNTGVTRWVPLRINKSSEIRLARFAYFPRFRSTLRMFSSEPQTRKPRNMDNEINLKKLDSGNSFECEINEEWSQGRACFGGLLLAMSARAAAHSVPEGRPLRAMNMTYVAPVSVGA